MPCSCILDKPLYPQNAEWGSLVWMILHTCAEKSGKQTLPFLQNDEGRAWPLVVKTLPAMLPCPFCRDHAISWLQEHPFQLPAEYALWHSYIRTWFWNFHENVNARLEKPSFSFEALAKTYAETKLIPGAWIQLEKTEKRAIQMNGVSLLAWQTWQKHVRMLQAALCI